VARLSAILIFLVVLLAILAGSVVLQVYLSKRENKWPGLVLPIITLAFSLMAALGMTIFTTTGAFTQSEYIDGEWVVVAQEVHREVTPGAVAGVISTFFLMNIPTAVFLVIYASCRGRRDKMRAIEKMCIQDLE